jgi:transposase
MSVEAPVNPAICNDENASVGIQSLSEGELDALLERISDAKEHNLALSVADYDILLNTILTLANMQERLGQNELTRSRMRKLLGMVSGSEKLKNLRPQNADTLDTNTQKPSARKGRTSKASRKPGAKTPKIKPTITHHKIESLSKGDSCPECTIGKVYKYTPASLLRITGHSAYSAQKHVIEQLRCNACGEVFSANLPESVKSDAHVDQQYGYSARAMIGINKYFGGSPFYRQESLQTLFGAPVASSTPWDQCEKLANDLHGIFKYLKTLGANAHTFYLDDTTNRILNKVPIKKTRNGKTQCRSGVYTSACLALLSENAAKTDNQ